MWSHEQSLLCETRCASGHRFKPPTFQPSYGFIPGSLQRYKEPHVNVSIYAVDIVLWCVWPACRTTVRARLQEALNAVSARLTNLGLAVSPLKTTCMVSRPRGRLLPTQGTIYLNGEHVKRVRTHKYLGTVIDNRANWRPAITNVLTTSRKLFPLLCLHKIGKYERFKYVIDIINLRK